MLTSKSVQINQVVLLATDNVCSMLNGRDILLQYIPGIGTEAGLLSQYKSTFIMLVSWPINQFILLPSVGIGCNIGWCSSNLRALQT